MKGALFILFGLLASVAPCVTLEADPQINQLLEPIRVQYHLPALAGALITDRGVVAIGAVGVRKAGTNVPVTVNDQWHLGSETKAMTATLVAMLVQEGKLKWDTTIEQMYPDLATNVPEPFRTVTLLQLLSHRAGLGRDFDWSPYAGSRAPMMEKRRSVVGRITPAELAAAPGEKFLYSNLGYILAGSMAEQATKTQWEDLLQARLFKPLGMTNTGYGGLGTPGKLDEPWGHFEDGKPAASNGPMVDNPPIIGPAGRVHCTLEDWGKFIADLLRGLEGKPALLPKEMYQKLITPPFDGEYALGWLVVDRDWAGGKVLTHDGSNTMNYAMAWVVYGKGFALLVCANQGGSQAKKGCNDASAALSQYFQKTHP